HERAPVLAVIGVNHLAAHVLISSQAGAISSLRPAGLAEGCPKPRQALIKIFLGDRLSEFHLQSSHFTNFQTFSDHFMAGRDAWPDGPSLAEKTPLYIPPSRHAQPRFLTDRDERNAYASFD